MLADKYDGYALERKPIIKGSKDVEKYCCEFTKTHKRPTAFYCSAVFRGICFRWRDGLLP